MHASILFFTVIGFLVWVWFCFEVGYYLGMKLDGVGHRNLLLEPALTELERLFAALSETVGGPVATAYRTTVPWPPKGAR